MRVLRALLGRLRSFGILWPHVFSQMRHQRLGCGHDGEPDLCERNPECRTWLRLGWIAARAQLVALGNPEWRRLWPVGSRHRPASAAQLHGPFAGLEESVQTPGPGRTWPRRKARRAACR